MSTAEVVRVPIAVPKKGTADRPTEVRMIPLSQIKDSKTNPREGEDIELAGLAADIAQRGVLEPVMVRPLAKESYELVFGHRRTKASRLAKLDVIPALVRELTDEEAFEIQSVENEQRENLHPLESAHVLVKLYGQECKRQGMSREHEVNPDKAIERVAARIGKPPKYVAKRMKLNDLIVPLKDAFLKGERVLLGHAELLAPLHPDQQAAAWKWMNKDGDMQTEGGERVKVNLITVAALRTWITGSFMLDLSKAPFPLDDPKLSPKLGACTTCQYRTSNKPALFGEAVGKGDLCTFPADYFLKRDNWLDAKVVAQERERGAKQVLRVGIGDNYTNAHSSHPIKINAEVGEYGAKAKLVTKACEHTKPGIVVYINPHMKPKEKLYDEVNVCTSPQTCKTHKDASSVQSSFSSSGRSTSSAKPTVEDRDRTRITNLKASIAPKTHDAIILNICAKAKELDAKLDKRTRDLLRIVKGETFGMLYSDRHRELAKNVFGKDPKSLKTPGQYGGGWSGTDYDKLIEQELGDAPLAWLVAQACMADYQSSSKVSSVVELSDYFKVDTASVRKVVAAGIEKKISVIAAQGERRKEKSKTRKPKASTSPQGRGSVKAAVKAKTKGSKPSTPTKTKSAVKRG
jgi:ParB/RepB/Spo0J family partition protein